MGEGQRDPWDEPEVPEPVASADEALAPLVALGNPLRFRGLIPLCGGALLAVVVAASDVSPRRGVALGLLAALMAVAGVLDLLGSFDDRPSETAVPLTQLFRPGLAAVAAAAAMVVVLRGAVAGWMPWWGSALLLPSAFLTLVVAMFRVGERLGPLRCDELGRRRPLAERHGFWLVVFVTLLYLPMLGNHALSDPWETHYGEVAREILARGDWISLWWAQDGWFWSKPVLSFWSQAIVMALLGVRYEPGQMLAAAGDGLLPQPEWALRMPVFLMTLAALYLLYKGVARCATRRAGLLAAIVLATMPQFFLVAQQTMTDMPFVAMTTASVGLFLMATRADPEAWVPVYAVRVGRRSLSLSLYHLVMGAALLLVLPQIFYLLSRNLSITLSPHFDLRFVGDRFNSGSFGNCGLPGNEVCRAALEPVVTRLQPVVQALVWVQALALVLWMCWGERRVQRLLYLAAWMAAALATMAKGPAGLAFPVLAAFCYLVGAGRWRELSRMQITAGLLLFSAVVLPWFVAMYARHGQPFTDRLLFHDMYKRAFRHVHDTNRGDDTTFRYYLWQLGYAAFPWTGLVPVALVRWLGRVRAADPRLPLTLSMGGWFVVGFALFSAMGTKYHHYILPVLPPMAALTGLWLDDWLSERADAPRGVMWAALAIAAALITLLVGRDLAWQLSDRASQIRLLHLFTYNYARPWPSDLDFGAALWAFTGLATLLLAMLAVHRARRAAVAGLVTLAACITAWGVDVYLVQLSPHWGQRELVLRYEQLAREQPGQLVAFQMNWKGENFYRGNQLPVFVKSGQRFERWIDDQKKSGVKTFYFLTEHTRRQGLHSELGRPPAYEVLTDKALNNKFLLVRARFE
jgi:4-amino-4-deoxy-L-arabinose transferase-like glycosyltransferase